MMGQRLSLHGLDALRKTRELGFPCPGGPSLALGQTAFCGALSRSSWRLLRERPAPGRGYPGNRFARVPRGRGLCPPSGGPALGRLNPERILPLPAPPKGAHPALGAGCCSGRRACSALRVLSGAWRHLRGWRLASPATSTVRELVALRLIVLPGRLCNGLSLNTNANHSMTRMWKSPANGALHAEATLQFHLR